MASFSFITGRPLWVNILAAVSLTVLVVIIFLQLLGWITRHGEYLSVPAVIGENTREAIKLLESKGFDVVIADSVYFDEGEKGVVVKQLPDSNSTVKVNRTVFLTVSCVIPPLVEVPALEGKTTGFAIEILKRAHLKMGDTVHRPDFMRGSVLEQSYEGKQVAPGTKIPWGSRIDLVIGSGLSNQQVKVPELVGLSFLEAKIVLEQNGLNIGALIVDPGVQDTLSSFVYRQNPARLDENNEQVFIISGQLMDLWLSEKQPAITEQPF